MCNKRFNFSEVRDRQLKEKFMHLYYHDGKSKCRTPCVKNVYHSRFALRFPDLAITLLTIVFEKTIKITHSKFSTDEQTLLIRYECSVRCIFSIPMFVFERLGGSVSSGRTLLWIFITIFALSHVVHSSIKKCFYTGPSIKKINVMENLG